MSRPAGAPTIRSMQHVLRNIEAGKLADELLRRGIAPGRLVSAVVVPADETASETSAPSPREAADRLKALRRNCRLDGLDWRDLRDLGRKW